MGDQEIDQGELAVGLEQPQPPSGLLDQSIVDSGLRHDVLEPEPVRQGL